ncbi:hypothetical protein [Pseudonocardia sp. MH-G8]|uniref:hypothetical protein n=1 Tax=Pseudonocardia sp. MH-G8 TaxID=1854588 RepID=UPI001E2A0873|nr:hypothetical protein [Pseudonocardia sp. MH-G8]
MGGAPTEPQADPAPNVVPVAQADPEEPAEPDAVDSVLLASTVEPVDPDPEIADASELVKAVQLAEQEVARAAAEKAAAEERAAQERAAAEAAAANCDLDLSDLGRVKSNVQNAAEQLGCRFGEPDMHGVAGRAGTSDHPSGLAVDFMVDRATGDALASCTLANMDALGVKYVIWEQQINHGNGWKDMEDRGGATANHFDHVHVSFERGSGGGSVQGC